MLGALVREGDLLPSRTCTMEAAQGLQGAIETCGTLPPRPPFTYLHPKFGHPAPACLRGHDPQGTSAEGP